MDLFNELQVAVQSDMTIGSESTLYPPTTIKLALNRAYRKCGGLFRWPELEDAKKTSTEAGEEYYDYPQGWRPDSIWKIKIDGDRYGEVPDGSPLSYEDYLNWREDNPNSTDKKWANQWRRYFVYPVPTTTGDNNICVWGQRNVDTLVNDADVTIWSYSMPECNEAVILEAVAILKSKGEQEKSGEFRSVEAKGILLVAWNKIKQEQAKYKKVQPFFNVSDMFGKGSGTGQNTGNFDL